MAYCPPEGAEARGPSGSALRPAQHPEAYLVIFSKDVALGPLHSPPCHCPHSPWPQEGPALDGKERDLSPCFLRACRPSYVLGTPEPTPPGPGCAPSHPQELSQPDYRQAPPGSPGPPVVWHLGDQSSHTHRSAPSLC